MASVINLLLFLFLGVYCFANAQWSGDIGYQRDGRNWEISGSAQYEIDRGNKKGFIRGHGFINSNGQRGWGVSTGFSYKWRGRRSLDNQMKKICAECVSIKVMDTPEKLQEYRSHHKIDFAMIARYRNFYIDANQTVLHFKIKQVLETPPDDVNITEAKVFNIVAERASCAQICLKDVVRDDFMVTGAMFHGRLIIHDKLLLLDVLNKQNEAEKAEEPAGDGSGEGQRGKDVEEEKEKSGTEDSNDTKAKMTGKQEEQAEPENAQGKKAEGSLADQVVP